MTDISKTFLRKQLENKRDRLSPRERSDAADTIIRNLVKVLTPLKGKTLGMYFSIKTEADISPLLAEMAVQDKIFALPRVMGSEKPLKFNTWVLDEIMDEDIFGTPCATGEEAFPDIFIIPLLGFDDRGYRMGYGGGYYDRTLAHYKEEGREFTTIGIGYNALKLDVFPAQPHDVPLDFIVTETQMIACTHDK
jgi:5-formyltetrahydrofolate cyclo-ligase